MASETGSAARRPAVSRGWLKGQVSVPGWFRFRFRFGSRIPVRVRVQVRTGASLQLSLSLWPQAAHPERLGNVTSPQQDFCRTAGLRDLLNPVCTQRMPCWAATMASRGQPTAAFSGLSLMVPSDRRTADLFQAHAPKLEAHKCPTRSSGDPTGSTETPQEPTPPALAERRW